MSHFNSMAYWMAGRPGVSPTNGWLGRWLDGYLSGGSDLYAAAEIGTALPLHLVGAARRGTVVPTGRPYFGASAELRDQRQYQTLRTMRTGAHGPWYGAVGQAFVDQIDLAAALTPHYPEPEAQSPAEIVARLEVAARLINANLGFRVLTGRVGRFRLARQPAVHAPGPDGRTEPGDRSLLPSAGSSVVEPGDGDDVLGVRAHELGQ